MKRKPKDAWWYGAEQVRVPAWGAGRALAISVVVFPAVLAGVLISGPALPFGSWITPVALAAACVAATTAALLVLLPKAGRLYVLEDRVDWRPRLGRARSVFLHGAERVAFRPGYVELSDKSAKITVPYRFHGYKKVHGLLRERSEVFRHAQDLQLPFEVSGDAKEQGRYGWLYLLWFVPLLVGLDRRRLPLLVGTLGLVVFGSIALSRKSRRSPRMAPMLYRFEADRVCIRTWLGRKWHASPRLKSVRFRGRTVVVRFKDITTSLTISQEQVAYPLSILKERIEEWYRPRPEEPVPMQERPVEQPATVPVPDPWDIFSR